jgi:hypothetical protein
MNKRKNGQKLSIVYKTQNGTMIRHAPSSVVFDLFKAEYGASWFKLIMFPRLIGAVILNLIFGFFAFIGNNALVIVMPLCLSLVAYWLYYTVSKGYRLQDQLNFHRYSEDESTFMLLAPVMVFVLSYIISLTMFGYPTGELAFVQLILFHIVLIIYSSIGVSSVNTMERYDDYVAKQMKTSVFESESDLDHRMKQVCAEKLYQFNPPVVILNQLVSSDEYAIVGD